jgi:hypothetical protein
MAQRIKSPLLLTVLIVVLLSVGVAGAAKLITGKDIANHSITGKDIKKRSLPLSVLKATPAGTPGPPGATGAKGDPGPPGKIGLEGEVGPSAITEVQSLTGPIAETTPGTQLKFLGKPAEILVDDGYRGTVNATVSIGSTEGTIDDTAEFGVTICVSIEGEPVISLDADQEASGEFGVSPVISQRTAVNVSSGFFVEASEPFLAEIGPCVFNDVGKKLDDNDRVSGSVVVAAG